MRTFAPTPADGILDTIGGTPLVRLRRYLDQSSLSLFAKLEAGNPGGSAKDRPARVMIENALRSRTIDHDSVIVESSSGNMGIGLAQACAFHGLKFICVIDRNAQPNNVAIMQALGANVEVVERSAGEDLLAARLRRVQEIIEQVPRAFWPNQYANLANPQAHSEGTIREIDAVLGDSLDYLFVATSSTGTARGCQQFLREHGRRARVIAVDAEGSTLFGGVAGRRRIPGLGAGVEPPLARGQKFFELHRVSDIDCVVGCRRLAKREAILAGGSAGGVLETVRRLAPRLAGKTCAAILHDSGTRYLDTVFNDLWVRESLGLTSDELARRIEHDEVKKEIAV